MKALQLFWLFLSFLAAGVSSSAQQPESGVKLFQEIKSKAEKGDAGAQCQLGFSYLVGLDVPKDATQAVKWFRKAAEQGNVMAQYHLAICYNVGEGVKKNETAGFEWLRKAAVQNHREAQYSVAVCYRNGEGVEKNYVEAVNWFREAAKQGHAEAQLMLGQCYFIGEGIEEDKVEALQWFRKAAAQDQSRALSYIGMCYENGYGVMKDAVEAVKWYRLAAYLGDTIAQAKLAEHYFDGDGVPKDYVKAYKWCLLVMAQGFKKEAYRESIATLESLMTKEQIAEGQKLARDFKPHKKELVDSAGGLSITGTGFFISEDGYLILNNHIIDGASQVYLVTSAGLISAKLIKADAANDLALLKAEGRFAALPVLPSRSVKLGSTVATVGFPNVGMQGFAPKLAKGEIAALSGAADDARYFQISVPVQPGNSGGALVDERGNVVGVVSAKLNASAALQASGALPENVNYAVKSSYLLSFLESVPEVSAKLKDVLADGPPRKFEDVVKEAEQAAVLVLVY